MNAVHDINKFLGNSVRSDLIGPEIWTSTLGGSPVENGDPATFVSGQLPYYAWNAPSPGLSGRLHIAHQTDLQDVACLEIAEMAEGRKAILRLMPVRNEWTPVLLRTWYRSIPAGWPNEHPKLGATTLKEVKCITDDNVFVAEATITNNTGFARSYELKLATPITLAQAGPPSQLAGPFHLTNVLMGTKMSWDVFVALATNLPAITHHVTLPPYGMLTFRYGFAIDSVTSAAAVASVQRTLADPHVFARNIELFNAWFSEKVPALAVDDADILKMYYYRWFVVFRSMHNPKRILPAHPYPRPAMYESPTGGWYGCVIGLPVPMQIQEAAWLRDPVPGRNQILNWCDGVIGYDAAPNDAYIQFTPMSIWRFLQCHPDKVMAQSVFEKVRVYAMNKAGNRFDQLPNQTSSWPCGAEYQPNFYQFTIPPWDFRHDKEFDRKHPGQEFSPTTITRLDTAGYASGNLLGAAKIASYIGDDIDAGIFAAGAASFLDILRKKHWDARLELFLACDPATGHLADQAACYDSFVPYMWGMIKEGKYLAAFRKFTDPAWFWDEFPISTVAKTCPMYFGGNALVGPAFASLDKPHEYGCSWNGPTWHYSNSLAAEAFGQAGIRAHEWRSQWLEYFRLWTEMHFQYGDRSVRALQHHRPEDAGRCASTTDYFHSSWIDPFVRYWCGISVSDDLQTLTFDPFHLGNFRIESLPIAGIELDFEQMIRAADGSRTLTVQDAKGLTLASGTAPLILHLLQP